MCELKEGRAVLFKWESHNLNLLARRHAMCELAFRGTVQKMFAEDCVCCIIFDEISVSENLHYNQKFGCIEGSEDLGSHSRTSSFANHALVFMLCGLRKRWKQPVAYYLIHGNTKGEMLLISWWGFLMSAIMQEQKLLPLCVTWVPAASRP
jgi:hypothetical protein